MHHFFSNAIVLLSFVFHGCVVGPGVSSTFKPGGLEGTILLQNTVDIERLSELTSRRFSIELLALEDNDIFVLSDNRIIQIRYGSIKAIKLKNGGTQRFKKNTSDGDVKTRMFGKLSGRLQVLSRFPQGISPVLLDQLLLAHGQKELIVVP